MLSVLFAGRWETVFDHSFLILRKRRYENESHVRLSIMDILFLCLQQWSTTGIQKYRHTRMPGMILQQERRRGRGESEYCDFSCYKTPIFLYSWTQKGEKNEILILRSFNRSFRIMIRNMKDTHTSCFPVPSDPPFPPVPFPNARLSHTDIQTGMHLICCTCA